MEDNLPIKNEGRLVAVEDRVTKNEERMEKIGDDVSEIKTKLLGRPTVAMTALISVLIFIATACGTWALTVLNLVIEVGHNG